MQKLAIAFLIVALLAAVFGYGGISASAAPVLQLLFWAFAILAILTLMIGWTFRKPPLG